MATTDKPSLHLVPVSERVEGDSVLGRISAMVAKGCPGPAGRWPCALEFGHESGEHVRADSFEGYLLGSLKEVQDGVSKLKAERDELRRALTDVAIPTLRYCERAFGVNPRHRIEIEAAIAKAEEGR